MILVKKSKERKMKYIFLFFVCFVTILLFIVSPPYRLSLWYTWNTQSSVFFLIFSSLIMINISMLLCMFLFRLTKKIFIKLLAWTELFSTFFLLLLWTINYTEIQRVISPSISGSPYKYDWALDTLIGDLTFIFNLAFIYISLHLYYVITDEN